MRLALLNGPLLVLLWQTAPISVQQDLGGKLHVSFGYGTGQYEVRRYSCAGNYLGADPQPFSSVTAHTDLWPNHRFRLSGFAGRYSNSAQHNPIYGAAAALEFRRVGLGFGRAFGYSEDAIPSLYLRFGDIDKAHFRFDVAYPSAAFPVTGDLRLGVGFNQGVKGGSRGVFGISVPNTYANGTVGTGPFLEITVPTFDRFGISLHGVYRPSREYTDWGLGVAGHYMLPIPQLFPVPR